MARTPDLDKRQELLDRIVEHLAVHGLAQATLRPMAAALGVSINRLVHHFGSKDELIETALARAIEMQVEVQRRWMDRAPNLTAAQRYRKWWAWVNESPRHLALVRLNYEAAALDSGVTGLAGDVRADQIGVWRHDVEQQLVREGVPAERAALEASLIKATFTGLAMDLMATGDRRRLNRAFTTWIERLEANIADARASAGVGAA
jgi:AcrR family transcriptional regulator